MVNALWYNLLMVLYCKYLGVVLQHHAPNGLCDEIPPLSHERMATTATGH